MKSLTYRRLLTPALMVAMVFGAVTASDAQTKKISAASRLPKDVYVYFSVPNVTEFKKRYSQTGVGKLLTDPAFAEIRKDIEAHLKQASAQAEKATGYTLEKLLTIFDGEATLAVVKGGKLPGFVVFIDFGTRKAIVDKLLALAEQTAKREGAAVSSEKVLGTTIKLITPPGAGAGEEGDIRTGPKRYAYCVKDTQLIFSTHIPSLKKVLANWSGENKNSFAKSDVYSYITKRCRTDGRVPAMEWYLNPIDLVQDIVRANNNGLPFQAQMAMNLLPLLGITKFRAIGGSVDMATKEFEAVSKSVTYVEKPTTGLLNFFQFPATKQAPPNWVADDVSNYMGFNWNVGTAYKSFETFFNMVGPIGQLPPLKQFVDKIANDPNGPGIHIKDDVIDQLSGKIHFASDIDADAGTPRFTVSIGVKDVKKTNALIQKIANDPNFPGKKRKVNGRDLYEVDFGAAIGGNTGPMGFAVAGGSLIISGDIKLLERIVSGKPAAKPLVGSAAYKRLSARFPAQTSMISYQRNDAQGKVIWDQIRGGALPMNIPGIDLTKLPPFEALQKYLLTTGGYTIPDKNGAYSESFSLRKK